MLQHGRQARRSRALDHGGTGALVRCGTGGTFATRDWEVRLLDVRARGIGHPLLCSSQTLNQLNVSK